MVFISSFLGCPKWGNFLCVVLVLVVSVSGQCWKKFIALQAYFCHPAAPGHLSSSSYRRRPVSIAPQGQIKNVCDAVDSRIRGNDEFFSDTGHLQLALTTIYYLSTCGFLSVVL